MVGGPTAAFTGCRVFCGWKDAYISAFLTAQLHMFIVAIETCSDGCIRTSGELHHHPIYVHIWGRLA
jgi:hypothetical protein